MPPARFHSGLRAIPPSSVGINGGPPCSARTDPDRFRPQARCCSSARCRPVSKECSRAVGSVDCKGLWRLRCLFSFSPHRCHGGAHADDGGALRPPNLHAGPLAQPPSVMSCSPGQTTSSAGFFRRPDRGRRSCLAGAAGHLLLLCRRRRINTAVLLAGRADLHPCREFESRRSFQRARGPAFRPQAHR